MMATRSARAAASRNCAGLGALLFASLQAKQITQQFPGSYPRELSRRSTLGELLRPATPPPRCMRTLQQGQCSGVCSKTHPLGRVRERFFFLARTLIWDCWLLAWQALQMSSPGMSRARLHRGQSPRSRQIFAWAALGMYIRPWIVAPILAGGDASRGLVPGLAARLSS